VHTNQTSADGRRTTTRVRAVAAGLLAAAIAAGCSSAPPAPPSPPPAPPTTTAAAYSPELCAAATQFQTAANALVQLDATKVGTDGVKAALQALADAGRNLVTAAKAQFAPQVAALEQALAALQTTITQIGDQAGLSAKLGALTASVAQVEAAAEPIVATVRSGCTGVPPASLPPTS
jgi:hypothetical protein